MDPRLWGIRWPGEDAQSFVVCTELPLGKQSEEEARGEGHVSGSDHSSVRGWNMVITAAIRGPEEGESGPLMAAVITMFQPLTLL